MTMIPKCICPNGFSLGMKINPACPVHAVDIAQATREHETVNHPLHYGGAENPYEAIKVIEAWGLGFCLGNAVKYIARAGKKDDMLQDLRKARWYLDREISRLEGSA